MPFAIPPSAGKWIDRSIRIIGHAARVTTELWRAKAKKEEHDLKREKLRLRHQERMEKLRRDKDPD